jgi:hypothetical protein
VLAGIVTACQEPSPTPPDPLASGLTATILATEGNVTALIAPSTAYREAGIGDTLAGGDSLRTGAASWSTLALFGDTILVVAPQTELTVSALDGTTESPLVSLALNAGEVFSIRGSELGPDGQYEVTTPAGVFAIRGTGMSAFHDPAAGSSEGTCLFGLCRAAAGGASVDLAGNQHIIISATQGIIGQPAPLTPAQLDRWSTALEKAQAAGGGQAADAVCDCRDGADLVCDDGTVIEDFPVCASGVLSAPSGADARLLSVPSWAGTITATDVRSEPEVIVTADWRDEITGGSTTQGSVRYDWVSPGRWIGAQGDLEWVINTTYVKYSLDEAGNANFFSSAVDDGSAALTLDAELSTIVIDLEAGTYELAFIPAGLDALTVDESKVIMVDGNQVENVLTYQVFQFASDPASPCGSRTYPGICARANGIPLPAGGLVLAGSATLPDGSVLTWSLTPSD